MCERSNGLWVLAALLPLALLAACSPAQQAAAPETSVQIVEATTYADGSYRGVYNDGGIEQFSVEFELKDNRFVSVTLHSVNYRDGNYLGSDVTRIQAQVAAQYEEAANYLVGKPVSAVADLMDQSRVTSDQDAVTAATLRTGKLISALRDGLRRGAFVPAAQDALSLPEQLPDGIYRGAYFEDARELVAVEFTLQENLLNAVQIWASGKTSSSRVRASGCETLLVGEPISVLQILYAERDLGLNATGVTGNMVASAFMDAISRGVFEPVATTVFPVLSGYETGVYRGFYFEGGVERVSIQFELVNDAFGAIQFRALANDEGNCLAEEAPQSRKAVAAQFRALADYLAGKEISRVYDLFEPERIVADAADSPAEELAPSELISAIMDGLCRGVYRPLEID